MLNSILRACIQQAVHAGSLYVYTTISAGKASSISAELVNKFAFRYLRGGLQRFRVNPEHERVVREQVHVLAEEDDAVHARVLQFPTRQKRRQRRRRRRCAVAAVEQTREPERLEWSAMRTLAYFPQKDS